MATLGDDFSSFLVDLNDLDLDFAAQQNAAAQQNHQAAFAAQQAQQQHQHQSQQQSHLQQQQQQRQSQSQPQFSQAHVPNVVQDGGMFDFNMSVDMQFDMAPQNAHHMMHPSGLVPPTPNSVEMHGETAARYLQQFEAHRAMMEQYQMKRTEAQAFTPIVSPGHHGHDGHFDNYTTVPGAYFSPLTSPALEGQQYPYQTTTSSSVATASPVDIDGEAQDSHNLKTQSAATKTRKRAGPMPRAAGAAAARTKNSPATKAQTKRKTATNSLAVTDASGMTYIPSPNIIPSPAQATNNNSVSPEPLSAEPMGPPQKPASATQSPAIQAQGSRSGGSDTFPVTPATLFKTQQLPVNSKVRGRQGRGANKNDLQLPVLTPLALPEAASSETDVDMQDDESSSRKTPKLGPTSTPSGSQTPLTNIAMTPLSAISSPLSATFPSLKKSDSKSRAAKKRGSISTNVLVSPALRPKISPSIKPLLPEGAVSHDDAHTIFLASRSNYQNLIDGTHVPGVSYPTELSTNLTSKRTSHKIAEQGRRNRINLALQEMLRLLPTTSRSAEANGSPEDDDEVGGDGSGSGGKKTEAGGANGSSSANKANGNSKAATVESAIEYIKSLKKEQEELARVAEEKDKECEALRQRLKAMERICEEKGVSPGDDTGSD